MRPLLNPYLDAFRAGLPIEARKPLIWAYSWAIPSNEAILAIAEHSPLVELGAGTGYWSWLLRQAGADVACLDSRTEAPPHWTLVQNAGPEQLESFPDRALLLVWPPLAGPHQQCMALEALRHWQGQTLIYVGEGPGGRTASDPFHDRLARDFRQIGKLEIPCWPGFRDSVWFYGRVGQPEGLRP